MTVSGWFTDPGGKVNTFRWWNGEAWTRWLTADPTAPDPGPEPKPTGAESTPHVAEPVPPADPIDLTTLPPPNPADRVVRLPVAAAIVVVVLLLTVIAVGAIVSFTADRPLTGPPVDPPPPTAVQARAKMSYDPATRKVAFEEMQFIAPGPPFACNAQPLELGGMFTSQFGCDALVHRNYDKKNSSWFTTVAMGHLNDRLQAGGDLATIASRTFEELLPLYYGRAKATVKKRKIQQLTGVAPTGRAVLLSAEVHVSKPGLPTKYDRAVLVVVRVRSGEHVAWYGLQANDSPKDVVNALKDSANTITAR